MLSWPGEARVAGAWPALADASFIAMSKGLVAGATDLVLALSTQAAWPPAGVVVGAALLGFASYGASLGLLVIGLRHTHRHRHESLRHSHAHFPDAHHLHPH